MKKARKAAGEKRPVLRMLADRAYEGDETRSLIREMGMKPVIPPKSNRTQPWKYSRKTYKFRNVVERLFRRLDNFRRVYTRYDKTDVMYMAFVSFALTMICLN